VIEELHLEPPLEREVKVEIAACAICHSDIHFADGSWGGELPAVYGHEAAGVVSEVGSRVRRVRPGDRVVVSLLRSCGHCFFCVRNEPHLCEGEFEGDRDGRLRTVNGEPVLRAMHTAAFAEEVVVDESQLALVPPSLSSEAAALLGCTVITGFGAVVDRARVPRGSSVVVLGTGGVGLNSLQGARVSGAEPVIGVDVSPAKRELATVFGATQVLDPATGDLVTEVRKLTGGRGADYVFVTVGRAATIEQSFGCVRRGGTLVVVGMPPAGEAFEVVAVDLAHDDIRILGSKMGSTRLELAVPRLAELYERGQIRIDELVSRRYPLDEINDAMTAAREGEVVRIVITLSA
jgi:Zn-dependent alcohol dehydrogenase